MSDKTADQRLQLSSDAPARDDLPNELIARYDNLADTGVMTAIQKSIMNRASDGFTVDQQSARLSQYYGLELGIYDFASDCDSAMKARIYGRLKRAYQETCPSIGDWWTRQSMQSDAFRDVFAHLSELHRGRCSIDLPSLSSEDISRLEGSIAKLNADYEAATQRRFLHLGSILATLMALASFYDTFASE